eukprot:5607024-Prymnesium_polylepis.2
MRVEQQPTRGRSRPQWRRSESVVAHALPRGRFPGLKRLPLRAVPRKDGVALPVRVLLDAVGVPAWHRAPRSEEGDLRHGSPRNEPLGAIETARMRLARVQPLDDAITCLARLHHLKIRRPDASNLEAPQLHGVHDGLPHGLHGRSALCGYERAAAARKPQAATLEPKLRGRPIH